MTTPATLARRAADRAAAAAAAEAYELRVGHESSIGCQTEPIDTRDDAAYGPSDVVL